MTLSSLRKNSFWKAYSGSYLNNLDCTYYVRKNSSRVLCYLELSFVKFEVEGSPKCQYDYFEVGTAWLCGSLQTKTVRTCTCIFKANEKVLKFHSDATTSRTDFFIKAEHLECQGDKIIRKIKTPAQSTVNSYFGPPVSPSKAITKTQNERHSPCNQEFS